MREEGDKSGKPEESKIESESINRHCGDRVRGRGDSARSALRRGSAHLSMSAHWWLPIPVPEPPMWPRGLLTSLVLTSRISIDGGEPTSPYLAMSAMVLAEDVGTERQPAVATADGPVQTEGRLAEPRLETRLGRVAEICPGMELAAACVGKRGATVGSVAVAAASKPASREASIIYYSMCR